MVSEPAQWVMDTSTYTHFCRAGIARIIEQLAPQGIVLVPREVDSEIEVARNAYPGIPSVDQAPWATRIFMTEDEEWSAMEVKAALGGTRTEHMGESAVIACAYNRGLVAVLDERAAIEQADVRGVESLDTLHIIALAFHSIFGGDKERAIAAVDALLDTDMYLPCKSGAELFE